MNQIVVFQERSPIRAGELRALVPVDQHLVLRRAPPRGHEQSLQHDVRGLAALQCPADDPAGIEVDDDGQISKTFARPDVGDVRGAATSNCRSSVLSIATAGPPP